MSAKTSESCPPSSHPIKRNGEVLHAKQRPEISINVNFRLTNTTKRRPLSTSRLTCQLQCQQPSSVQQALTWRATRLHDGSALMKTPAIAVAGLAAATVLVGMSAPGCSSKSDKATSSSSASATSTSSAGSQSSSPAAESGGYAKLLIKAEDIALPGDTFTAAPPTENPNGKSGVATVFSNQGDTREIGDTIMILPDAAGAATALEGARSSLGSAVKGGEAQPAAVGEGGTIVSGTSPDDSKSVTVLIFSEGKSFVTLEFDGKPDDPVPPAFATDIGQKQDAAIKSGLAG